MWRWSVRGGTCVVLKCEVSVCVYVCMLIYNFQQLKILVYQCSCSNPRGHVLVYCRLTPQENLGTSSAPSLPIHPSRPAGPTACDPLRPSSTAL